jgi:hypothetical protein
MAKAKDLIALAGLAGLAYANRDKLFGGKDESKTDTGDETDRLKGRGTPEEPRIDARSSGDEMSDIRRDVSSGDEMSKYASNYKPPKVPTPAVRPKPVVDNTTAAAIPSGIMGGARQRTNTVSSSAEGMKNYKPRRTAPTLMKEGGMTASSRADGIASRGKTRGKIC